MGIAVAPTSRFPERDAVFFFLFALWASEGNLTENPSRHRRSLTPNPWIISRTVVDNFPHAGITSHALSCTGAPRSVQQPPSIHGGNTTLPRPSPLLRARYSVKPHLGDRRVSTHGRGRALTPSPRRGQGARSVWA